MRRMTTTFVRTLPVRLAAGVLIPIALTGGSARPAAAAELPTNRTVFVTITDGNGAAVTDLTPADFVVKEGGKEREITQAAPATAKMHLVLAVEERLVGDAATRQAIFDFLKRMVSIAEIRMVIVGLRNQMVVDYTTRIDSFVEAINNFTLNPAKDSAVAEGVMEISNDFVQTKRERPVMVVVALGGGQSGVESRAVLDKIRDSGVTMYSATLGAAQANVTPLGGLSDQAGREQVLGDGPKQSGGRRIEVGATAGMPKALQQIANDLTAQYAITYVLPDGVKLDRRFNITVKRRGLNLRAPSTIPDR
jgi:VWFA-related protein